MDKASDEWNERSVFHGCKHANETNVLKYEHIEKGHLFQGDLSLKNL